jgi:hypothetical protein
MTPRNQPGTKTAAGSAAYTGRHASIQRNRKAAMAARPVEEFCERLTAVAPLTVQANKEAMRRLTYRALPDKDELVEMEREITACR